MQQVNFDYSVVEESNLGGITVSILGWDCLMNGGKGTGQSMAGSMHLPLLPVGPGDS